MEVGKEAMKEAPSDTAALFPNKCRLCFDPVKDDNLVRIHPCKCTFCKDCFIIYALQSRTVRKFVCSSCKVPINSICTSKKEYFCTTKSWITVSAINNINDDNNNSSQIIKASGTDSVAVKNNRDNTSKKKSSPSEASVQEKQQTAASLPAVVLAPAATEPLVGLSTECGESTDAIPSPKPKSPVLHADNGKSTNSISDENENHNDENENDNTDKTSTNIDNDNEKTFKRTPAKRKQRSSSDSVSKKRTRSAAKNDESSPANTSVDMPTPNSNDDKKIYKNTNKYIEELKAYKEQNGNCSVKLSANPSLARFIYQVRNGKRKVNTEQRKILDEIGFPWVLVKKKDLPKPKKRYIRERKSFEERLKDLENFKKQHGHVQVPYRYLPDKSLGEWVKAVRRCHIVMTKQQRKELNRIGFVWETKFNKFEREWNEKLDKLKKFKHTYGHCKIPYLWEQDKPLYEWCHTQRKLNNQNKLRTDRKNLLDSIGFYWGNNNNNDTDNNDNNNDNNDNDSTDQINDNINDNNNIDKSTTENNHDDDDDTEDDNDDDHNSIQQNIPNDNFISNSAAEIDIPPTHYEHV